MNVINTGGSMSVSSHNLVYYEGQHWVATDDPDVIYIRNLGAERRKLVVGENVFIERVVFVDGNVTMVNKVQKVVVKVVKDLRETTPTGEEYVTTVFPWAQVTMLDVDVEAAVDRARAEIGEFFS